MITNTILLNVTQLVASALHAIYSVSDLQVHWCTIYRCA